MKYRFRSLLHMLANQLKQFTPLRKLYAALFDAERSRQFELTEWMKRGCNISHKQAFKRVIFEAGEAWVTLPNGLEIRYITEIPGAGVEPCIYRGEYEPEITQRLLEQLNNSSTFIDIGANIGWFTLHAAHRYPGISIHAFEPGAFAYSNIDKNIERNRFKSHVKLNQRVVSDRCGSEIFSTQQLGHPLNHIIRSKRSSPAKGTPVAATTLDHYIEHHAITSIDLIKCDVEGAEMLVLKGARKLLKSHQPELLLEVNPLWTARFDYTPEQLWALLKDFGYHYQIIESDGSTRCSGHFASDVGEGANVYFSVQKKQP
ncbi:MAG: FkbM family methyltransferase [Gammaproteobacteria bacterium]|nr:FkbM family methyltransferase [Gammaproteobacteria bacterium]